MILVIINQPFFNSPPTPSLSKRGGKGELLFLIQNMHNNVFTYNKHAFNTASYRLSTQ